MQTITVHKANEDDAESLAQMAQSLAVYEGDRSMANAPAMRRLIAGEGEPNCRCLIAKSGSDNIGFVLYYAGYDLATVSEGFHLADLFVQEQYRGQSVGSKLLAEVAAQAQGEGREWISLTALRGNVDAKQFYDAKGFCDADVRFFAIGAKGIAKLTHKK